MALFTTIQEVKEFVEVSLQLSFEDIAPAIEIAEKKYLVPLLSESVYNSLIAAYAANTNLPSVSSANSNLLKAVRPVVANYAVSISMPRLNVEISSAGIHITSTETKKAAFAWQVKQAQASYIESGDMYADKLLSFLEANKTIYTDWASSTAFTEYIDNLVYTTKQVNDIVRIGSSRLLFLRMKPKLMMVQDFQIIDTIGSNYISELMNSIRANNTTSDNILVLTMLQKAMVYTAAADTLREGIFSFDSDGVTLIRNMNTDVVDGKDSPKLDIVAVTANKWTELGLAWLERIRIYLNANASASRYITYFNSGLYQDSTTSTGGLTNDPAWGVGMF